MPVVPRQYSPSGLELARIRLLSHRDCILKVWFTLPLCAYGNLCDSNVEQKRPLPTAHIVTTSVTASCDVHTKNTWVEKWCDWKRVQRQHHRILIDLSLIARLHITCVPVESSSNVSFYNATTVCATTSLHFFFFCYSSKKRSGIMQTAVFMLPSTYAVVWQVQLAWSRLETQEKMW